MHHSITPGRTQTNNLLTTRLLHLLAKDVHVQNYTNYSIHKQALQLVTPLNVATSENIDIQVYEYTVKTHSISKAEVTIQETFNSIHKEDTQMT